MTRVRSILRNLDIESISTDSAEHKCESLLLREFSKPRSKNKSLCEIQPVVFGGKYVQITTPIAASKQGEITYPKNGKGGGIDILARVRH